MVREDVVREMLARLARGEGIKRIARELGVDRKTVKAWRRRGGWRPRILGTGGGRSTPSRASSSGGPRRSAEYRRAAP
jgi:uncharacterized protein YjcR